MDNYNILATEERWLNFFNKNKLFSTQSKHKNSNKKYHKVHSCLKDLQHKTLALKLIYLKIN